MTHYVVSSLNHYSLEKHSPFLFWVFPGLWHWLGTPLPPGDIQKINCSKWGGEVMPLSAPSPSKDEDTLLQTIWSDGSTFLTQGPETSRRSLHCTGGDFGVKRSETTGHRSSRLCFALCWRFPENAHTMHSRSTDKTTMAALGHDQRCVVMTCGSSSISSFVSLVYHIPIYQSRLQTTTPGPQEPEYSTRTVRCGEKFPGSEGMPCLWTVLLLPTSPNPQLPLAFKEYAT